MVDFKNSFLKGIDAAKIADKCKKEIQSVFDDLNFQLSEYTEGKLKIEIKTFYINNTIQDLNDILYMKPRKTYQSVVAMNIAVPDDSGRQLARWWMNKNGYPCRIEISNDIMICEDRESLEKNLQLLLGDPTVGEQMYYLMNLLPPDEGDKISPESQD